MRFNDEIEFARWRRHDGRTMYWSGYTAGYRDGHSKLDNHPSWSHRNRC